MAVNADLYGDDHYSWGDLPNPPTEKQKNIIDFIYRRIGVRFQGSTSREAYRFINKHYNKAKRA
jgi:hypothetical protein